MNCNIGINLAKLNMKEFKDQIDRLVRKKKKKKQHKNNIKKMFWKMLLNCILEWILAHSESDNTDDEGDSNFETPR